MQSSSLTGLRDSTCYADLLLSVTIFQSVSISKAAIRNFAIFALLDIAPLSQIHSLPFDHRPQ